MSPDATGEATSQSLPETSHPDAGAILDAVLTSGTWMIRRKDFVEFQTEQDLYRTHSFDFEIPSGVISGSGEEGPSSAVVPLGFWWKAPGRFSDIDFEDESGKTLPLTTNSYNARLTYNMMLEYSRRLLGYKKVQELPKTVWVPLANIVGKEPKSAISEARQWRDKDEGPLATLAQSPEFLGMLEVSALASVLTTTLHDDLDRRRVIKLKYAEHQETYFRTDKYLAKPPARQGRLWRWLGRRARRILGLGAYKLDLGNAFVRGQSYHFEAKAPRGMKFSDVSIKRADVPPSAMPGGLEAMLHLHVADLPKDVIATVRSKLIVTDGWLTSAIICTGLAAAVLIGMIRNIENLDPAASQNVIAVALLVPSVAMSIVWRRVHRVVERLHQWLRYFFLSLAVLLFYLAFRIAESPISVEQVPTSAGQSFAPSRFVDGPELVCISWVVLIWTAVVMALLLAARFHIARLRDSWLRLSRRSES